MAGVEVVRPRWLRALHLDPDSGPPARCRYENEAKQETNDQWTHLYGGPKTDKGATHGVPAFHIRDPPGVYG